MALNLLKLASQGRAFDATRPWTQAELEGQLTLEKERELDRRVSAEYVRNGILTVEAYDAAKEAGVVPKSLEAIKDEAVVAHVAAIKEELGIDDEDEEEEKSDLEDGDKTDDADAKAKADADAKAEVKAKADAKAKAAAKIKAAKAKTI